MGKEPIVSQVVNGMMNAYPTSSYWSSDRRVVCQYLERAKIHKQRHGVTVFEHTMNLLDNLSTYNSITLLAGLFHDLGKCEVAAIEQPLGASKFQGHVRASVKIVSKQLILWDAKAYLADRVIRIVNTHMFDINSSTFNERTLRRFISLVGLDNIENWFAVRIADSMSYGNFKRYTKRVVMPFRDMVNKYAQKLSRDDDFSEFSHGLGGMQISGEEGGSR